MKKTVVLFFLFLSVNALAQSNGAVHKDTIYVLDSTLTDKKMEGINPNDILNVDVLVWAPGSANRDMINKVEVLVITKKYAKKEYQKKLASFSKKYEGYIETHSNNDDDCIYILNRIPITGENLGEITKRLYQIPFDKITTVDCAENPFFNSANANVKREIVLITTKQ